MDLTNEEMAEHLTKLPEFKQWIKQVEEAAIKRVRDDGQTIPGFKLVEGRGSRIWRDEAQVAKICQIHQVDAYEPQTLKSVAKLEKEKEVFALLNQLVERKAGALVLAPSSDKRPEWVVADFEDLNEKEMK